LKQYQNWINTWVEKYGSHSGCNYYWQAEEINAVKECKKLEIKLLF
jgi:hypothetical protein